MKNLCFSVLLCGALAFSASAQEEPKNGYQMLVGAGNAIVPGEIVPGENGSPSTLEKFQPEENLRLKRLAVARNLPALKKLREALRQNIEAPLPTADLEIAKYGTFRELGRQLQQESDVRLADGDAIGAFDSRLTSLELGVVLTRRAPYISSLTGQAIESMARKNLEQIVSRLDAVSLRAALERWKTIEERRAAYKEILGSEEAWVITVLTQMFKNPDYEESKKTLATPEGRQKIGVSEEQAREMLALTPEMVTADIAKVFDAIIERDQLPYQRALKVVVAPAQMEIVKAGMSLWLEPTPRFSYEQNLTQARLLQGALELRALQLETGAYPEKFEAPLDPFGENSRLIYQRDGEKYRLYSIGPDGKDDFGTEIETLETNAQSGLKTVTGRLRPNSLGDISAPIF